MQVTKMRTQMRTCCAATAWLLCWPLAAQQAPSLEQLLSTPLTDVPSQIEVSTAARYAQSSSHSVNVTYVVTAADIALFQWQTLADVLQSLPGIYISTDGAFKYVGIRGLGQPGDFNSRLLFLLDGVRVNENIYDAGLLGNDALVDVENIDRVEFAAGPGAAVYGNNAFFGVVNILTKTAQQLRGGAVNMTLQSDSSQRFFFNSAHRLEQGSEWWFSASHQQRPEIPLEFAAPDGLDTEFLQKNSEHLSRLRLGGRHHGLQMQALWATQQRISPLLYQHASGEKVASLLDRNDNFLLSLAHQQDLTPDLRLSGHLNQSGSRFRRDMPVDHPEAGDTILANDQLGRWFSADLLLQYQGLLTHDLLFGLEFQDDYRQRIELTLLSTDERVQGIYGHNQRKSLFIQDQWQFLPAHSLLLGLRYDESRVSQPQLNPRLGWVWQLSDSQHLKLLHGSAYRAANLYEFATNFAVDAPTPADEDISSTELTYEQQLSRRFSYRLTWFYADIHNLISQTAAQPIFVNARQVHNKGTELNLDWRLNNGAQLSAAWSWQHSQDQFGQTLQNSPAQLVKLQYQQPLSSLNAQFSLGLNAVSRRQVADTALPGYVVVQSGLYWQLAQHQLGVQVYNLLDQPVLDRPILSNPPSQQPGRVLSVSWRWQLW